MDDNNCIVDFGGSCWALSMPTANYWADWDPIKKIVSFGGLWHNVPDMPAETKPSEEEVHAWEQKHPSILSIRFAALRRESAKREKRSRALQKLFDSKGHNHCSVELINSLGSKIIYAREVGIMSRWQCLQSISLCIQQKGSRYFGYKVKAFGFTERITKADVAKLP